MSGGTWLQLWSMLSKNTESTVAVQEAYRLVDLSGEQQQLRQQTTVHAVVLLCHLGGQDRNGIWRRLVQRP